VLGQVLAIVRAKADAGFRARRAAHRRMGAGDAARAAGIRAAASVPGEIGAISPISCARHCRRN